MASEEEVKIVIDTIQGQNGAQNVADQLKDVQAEAEKAAFSVSRAMAELMKVGNAPPPQATPFGQVQDFARTAKQNQQEMDRATKEALQNELKDREEAARRETQLYAARAQQQRQFQQLVKEGQPEESPKPPGLNVSQSFAELMKANNAPPPTETPFGQVQDFARTAAENQKQQDLATKESLANEMKERDEAARRQTQQSDLRVAQEKQFQSLIQERAKASAKGGAVPADAMPAGAVDKLNDARNALSGVARGAAEAGESAGVSAMSMIRFGGALVGVGVGFSIFRASGQLLHQFFQTLIDDSIKSQQTMQDNTIVYGQNAAAFQTWATTISQQAGVAATELVRAGTAAEQFGRQIGFGPQQTNALVGMGQALSLIKGIGLDQSMDSLTAAIGGSAQAAQSLNLQLDAGYIAFTQMNGATAEAFGQLGTGEQEWLRYTSALQQIEKQAAETDPALVSLRKAQQELSNEWDRFIQSIAPSVVTGLTDIYTKADNALQLLNNIQDWSVQRNTTGKTIFGQDPNDADFKNERAALEAVKSKLGELADTDAGKSVLNLVDAVQKYHDQVDAASSDPGFKNDLNALGQAADTVTDKVNQAKDAASTALDLNPGADPAAQAKAAADLAAQQDHQQKLVDLANQLVPQHNILLAALDNEKEAAAALVDLASQQVQITADEARIKLSMLPTQEALAVAANQTAQAQLAAQRAALPSSRAQQDLQDRIRLNTLIAQSPDRSLQERQAALRTAAALVRRTPETDIAALQAQIAARGPERAAQDVANAQRDFALKQQQALQPDEFMKQQNDLYTQLVTAVKDAAHRTFEFTVNAINIVWQGTGLGALTDDDKKALADLVGQGVVDAFDAAIKSSDRRAASTSLIGAIGAI